MLKLTCSAIKIFTDTVVLSLQQSGISCVEEDGFRVHLSEIENPKYTSGKNIQLFIMFKGFHFQDFITSWQVVYIIRKPFCKYGYMKKVIRRVLELKQIQDSKCSVASPLYRGLYRGR
jgi:hypothetical protein